MYNYTQRLRQLLETMQKQIFIHYLQFGINATGVKMVNHVEVLERVYRSRCSSIRQTIMDVNIIYIVYITFHDFSLPLVYTFHDLSLPHVYTFQGLTWSFCPKGQGKAMRRVYNKNEVDIHNILS